MTRPRDRTAQEVAAYLRVHEETIRRYARAGRFAGAYHVGRNWRIPAEAVEAIRTDAPQAEEAHQ